MPNKKIPENFTVRKIFRDFCFLDGFCPSLF